LHELGFIKYSLTIYHVYTITGGHCANLLRQQCITVKEKYTENLMMVISLLHDNATFTSSCTGMYVWRSASHGVFY